MDLAPSLRPGLCHKSPRESIGWRVPGEQDFCLLPWPQEGAESRFPMGVEGRNSDPRVSVPWHSLALVHQHSNCSQRPHTGLVSAVWGQFQVQSVLPQVIKGHFSCRGWRWECGLPFWGHTLRLCPLWHLALTCPAVGVTWEIRVWNLECAGWCWWGKNSSSLGRGEA